MLKQISIVAENKAGVVHAIMDTLAKAQINVRALTIAENADYGVVRLIVNEPEKARNALSEFDARIAQVIGVTIPDKFGAFCDVVKILSENDINIEYSYSLMGCKHGNANILIRVKDTAKTADVLTQAGIKLFSQEDIT